MLNGRNQVAATCTGVNMTDVFEHVILPVHNVCISVLLVVWMEFHTWILLHFFFIIKYTIAKMCNINVSLPNDQIIFF